MIKQNRTGTNLASLLDTLENKDGATRQIARKSLVALGKPAVSSLNRALRDSKLNHVRWEAVKTLDAIGDIRSIPAIVIALEDSDADVAWSAAEALRKFKMAAWPPLLRALMKRGAGSVLLRQGAHHVLRNQREPGFTGLLSNLAKAIESGTVPESTTVAAYEILKRMKADR
jgi:HEAT repeat protein